MITYSEEREIAVLHRHKVIKLYYNIECFSSIMRIFDDYLTNEEDKAVLTAALLNVNQCHELILPGGFDAWCEHSLMTDINEYEEALLFVSRLLPPSPPEDDKYRGEDWIRRIVSNNDIYQLCMLTLKQITGTPHYQLNDAVTLMRLREQLSHYHVNMQDTSVSYNRASQCMEFCFTFGIKEQPWLLDLIL